jgi:hypothetical protein
MNACLACLNNRERLIMTTTLSQSVATEVQLYDGATSLGAVTMTGATTWTKQVSTLSAGSHSFTARTAQAASDPFKVSVVTTLTGVENFDSLPDIDIRVGESVQAPKMLLTFVNGPGAVTIRSADELPLDPYLQGKSVLSNSSGESTTMTLRMDLMGTCSKLSLYFQTGFFSSPEWIYRAYSGNVLLDQRINPPSGELEFEGPAISRIELEMKNLTLWMDNFRFS